MRFSNRLTQNSGIILTAIALVASIWLGLTKQLNLYINPHYINFTIAMAAIGLLALLLSARFIRSHDQIGSQSFKQPIVIRFGLIGICLLSVVGLLVVKPAVLTDTTVKQRGINSGIGASTQATNAVPLLSNGDYSSFTVKDWASLLVQTDDPSFYDHKTASIVGFTNPDADDPENVFYASRFFIVCCAVDAQPVGVPVYDPGWQSKYKPGSWVSVSGPFVANPSAKSSQRVAIQPSSVSAVGQPEDPYVY